MLSKNRREGLPGPKNSETARYCGFLSSGWRIRRLAVHIWPLRPAWRGYLRLDLGRLAQLAERLLYTQDVGGSIPSPPTRPNVAGSGVGHALEAVNTLRRDS